MTAVMKQLTYSDESGRNSSSSKLKSLVKLSAYCGQQENRITKLFRWI